MTPDEFLAHVATHARPSFRATLVSMAEWYATYGYLTAKQARIVTINANYLGVKPPDDLVVLPP